MTKVWDGPTPYDNSDWDDASPNAIREAYRAAMNSPVVRAMYEALVTRLTSSKRNSPQERLDMQLARAAYEAGLKENDDGNPLPIP